MIKVDGIHEKKSKISLVKTKESSKWEVDNINMLDILVRKRKKKGETWGG